MRYFVQKAVFDASCLTTSNVSLNDILRVGPVVQPDLYDILIRFRSHKIALTADLSKIYRRIWLNKSHWKYQCIL